MLAACSLWRREVVRFFRQRSRIAGALGTPVVFWLLIGSGFSGSWASIEPGSYLGYLYPGALAMILLFASIFSTISIIEDRREGFLQGVLISPAPRAAVVLGKVAGGATVALIQGLLFLALAPLALSGLTIAGAAAAAGVMTLLAFGLTALSTAIAWRLESTQGFHAVMNLFLMPMWLLSGAVFPSSGASGWLQWLMMADPLTYGVAALRLALQADWSPGLAGSLMATACFSGLAFILAIKVASAPDRRGGA